jgi:hypothetical protein
MEKIRLGRTEMMVSRLGFGGIPIQRISEDEAVAVVRGCLELGINFIDTANGYTTSEERIGKAVSGQRQNVIIATKSFARTREEMEAHLKMSLERLGVDYIDLYQFHNVSDARTLDMILAPDGAMSVLEKAKKAGRVRHIGITSHQMDTAKQAVQSDRFETIMFAFNFIASEAAEELLPLARKHDVGFIVMKPLAGGMVSNATVAFKYLSRFPDVVPIPGIEKKSQMEEIIKAMEGAGRMTGAERREMQRIKDELGPRFCHHCDYCQPCTQEIPISMVMDVKSIFKNMTPEQVFGEEGIARVMEKAATCSECGDCETRCPYELPVREIIAEQVAFYQEEKKKYQQRQASG